MFTSRFSGNSVAFMPQSNKRLISVEIAADLNAVLCLTVLPLLAFSFFFFLIVLGGENGWNEEEYVVKESLRQ